MRVAFQYVNGGFEILLSPENEADKVIARLIDKDELKVTALSGDSVRISQQIGKTRSADWR